MTTLETIVQELQQVPPQHLESAYQLIHALAARPAEEAGNVAAVGRIMSAAGMLSDWNDEEWAAFEAELKRIRANKKLAAETMRILEGIDDLPDEEWNAINEHMRRLRTELFTRPLPDFGDESNAA